MRRNTIAARDRVVNNLLAGISGSLEIMQSQVRQGRVNDIERYMTAAQEP